MMQVAVVGAGWAGLAAATLLNERGHAVTVFDLSHTPGGRAQRVTRPGFQAPLDNGQHILLGAYDETLALMRRLSYDPEERLLRVPLTLASVDGEFRLRAARLPAPFGTLGGLLRASGLGLADRWAAVRFILALRRDRWQTGDAQTVGQLLAEHSQPAPLVARLWAPLCLAALNTPLDQACARLFCNVLRDSLDNGRHASDLLLPRTDMSSLWPDAAADACSMRYGHPVRAIQPGPNDVQIDSETFDAAIVATPPYIAARLFSPHAPAADLVATLRGFEYAPIATLTVQLASAMRPLPAPMLVLREDASRGHYGQWLFDRTALLGLDPSRPELTVVASAAHALGALPRSLAMQYLRTQLAEQLALPPVTHTELIIEKRATFTALPGLQRPGNATPWPRVVVAGDYTDTGYPAVLEGAVRSGLQAAKLLMEQTV